MEPATAAVPLCGITTPHNHSSFDDPIDCAWRDRQTATACENLVRQPGGYYRCSLPQGHLTACVPDAGHVAHDEDLARRMLAEINYRRMAATVASVQR